MKIIQEILLGLGIAITLPVMVYWGIHSIYPVNHIEIVQAEGQEFSPENKALQKQQVQEKETLNKITFWTCFITALLSFFLGVFITDYSLSIGFIGGGLITLIIAIAHARHVLPLINFGTFASLFFALIWIIAYRKH